MWSLLIGGRRSWARQVGSKQAAPQQSRVKKIYFSPRADETPVKWVTEGEENGLQFKCDLWEIGLKWKTNLSSIFTLYLDPSAYVRTPLPDCLGGERRSTTLYHTGCRIFYFINLKPYIPAGFQLVLGLFNSAKRLWVCGRRVGKMQDAVMETAQIRVRSREKYDLNSDNKSWKSTFT